MEYGSEDPVEVCATLKVLTPQNNCPFAPIWSYLIL